MTIAHHLRGYHRETGYLGAEFSISAGTLRDVQAILRDDRNDPNLINPHELAQEQTLRLAEILNCPADPARFDYFVEAEEDWRVVAAIRDARYVEV